MEKLLSKPDLQNAPELGGITHGTARARGEGSEENGVRSLICVKRSLATPLTDTALNSFTNKSSGPLKIIPWRSGIMFSYVKH